MLILNKESKTLIQHLDIMFGDDPLYNPSKFNIPMSLLLVQVLFFTDLPFVISCISTIVFMSRNIDKWDVGSKAFQYVSLYFASFFKLVKSLFEKISTKHVS